MAGNLNMENKNKQASEIRLGTAEEPEGALEGEVGAEEEDDSRVGRTAPLMTSVEGLSPPTEQGIKLPDPPPFQATLIWNEIVADLKACVPLKRRRLDRTRYERCFTGAEAVDVVHRYLATHETHFDQARVTRDRVIKLCQLLIDFQVIVPLRGATDRRRFEDGRTRLYCFAPNQPDGEPVGEPVGTRSISSSSSNVSENIYSSQITSVKEEQSDDGSLDCEVISNRALLSQQRSRSSLLSAESPSFPLGGGWKRHSAECMHAPSPLLPRSQFSRRPSLQPFCVSLRVNCVHRAGSPVQPDTDENTILRETALSDLLTLVDLPMLDGIAHCDPAPSWGWQNRRASVGSGLPTLAYQNSAFKRFGSSSSVFSPSDEKKSEDDWWTLAVDCVQALPSPQDPHNFSTSTSAARFLDLIDLSFTPNISDARKRELFRLISDRCGGHADRGQTTRGVFASHGTLGHGAFDHGALWPESFAPLHVELYRLLMRGGVARTVRALRLSIALLDGETCARVRAVLAFMALAGDEGQVRLSDKTSNRAVVERTFSCVIVPCGTLTPHQTTQLHSFMVEHYAELWSAPADTSELARSRAASTKDVLTPERSFCRRISAVQFETERADWTEKCLVDLMNSILDDTRMSLKQKKHHMKLFAKHHASLYLKHFPNMV